MLGFGYREGNMFVDLKEYPTPRTNQTPKKIRRMNFDNLPNPFERCSWFVMGRYYLSHEQKPLTFRYTGCLIGIRLMVYNNPYITG